MPTEAIAKYVAQSEAQICISLAGKIAERRARRCDDGDRRCAFLLTENQRQATHEAGHAVVGVAMGWSCSDLSIVPEPAVLVGNGHLGGFACVHEGPALENAKQRESRRKATRYLESDSRKIAQLALQLALLQPDFGWRAARRIIRTLRARAESLVEMNWRQIEYLARELEWRKKMDGEQIEVCLRSSLVAAELGSRRSTSI